MCHSSHFALNSIFASHMYGVIVHTDELLHCRADTHLSMQTVPAKARGMAIGQWTDEANAKPQLSCFINSLFYSWDGPVTMSAVTHCLTPISFKCQIKMFTLFQAYISSHWCTPSNSLFHCRSAHIGPKINANIKIYRKPHVTRRGWLLFSVLLPKHRRHGNLCWLQRCVRHPSRTTVRVVSCRVESTRWKRFHFLCSQIRHTRTRRPTSDASTSNWFRVWYNIK